MSKPIRRENSENPDEGDSKINNSDFEIERAESFMDGSLATRDNEKFTNNDQNKDDDVNDILINKWR